MINQDLLDYISALREEFTDSAIKERLLLDGVPEAEIDAHFQAALARSGEAAQGAPTMPLPAPGETPAPGALPSIPSTDPVGYSPPVSQAASAPPAAVAEAPAPARGLPPDAPLAARHPILFSIAVMSGGAILTFPVIYMLKRPPSMDWAQEAFKHRDPSPQITAPDLPVPKKPATEEGAQSPPTLAPIPRDSSLGSRPGDGPKMREDPNATGPVSAGPEDPEEQYQLALRYKSGDGEMKSDKMAALWFAYAAEQGHVLAQVNLGFMFVSGRGVPKSGANAAKWFKKAAEAGNAFGQYNLAILHATGDGVLRDHVEAYKWLTLAALQGDEEAIKRKRLFEEKLLTPPQIEEGKKRASALKGAVAPADLDSITDSDDPEILVRLAKKHMDADPKKAAGFLERSAEQDNAEAAFLLGEMYRDGRGVPADGGLAAGWLGKAAEKDHVPAQTALGLLFLNGKSVAQDGTRAQQWLRRASGAGDAYAQSVLAYMYGNGLAVKVNDVEALKWRLVATRNGNADTRGLEAALRARMDGVAVAEAEKRAARER